LQPDGTPQDEAVRCDDLAGEIAARERDGRPRWVWAATSSIYPRLLRRGTRVQRCHDVELTEALLLGHDGRWGEPRSLAAIHARAHGLPVPPDREPDEADPPGQARLFDDLPTTTDLDTVVQAYRGQLGRIGRPKIRDGSGCSWRPSRRGRWPPPRWATSVCRWMPARTTRCCATSWANPGRVAAPRGG
jgi:hypothetical protein